MTTKTRMSRLVLASACVATLIVRAPLVHAADAAAAQTFDSPQRAVDALLGAVEKGDEQALIAIFGPEGDDIIHTGEPARDKQNREKFLAKVHEQKRVSTDPKNRDRAVFVIGKDHWPFPVPLVRTDGKWSFDSKAGLQEILFRRIGGNELDAIQICHGYVEAQNEYAAAKRGDAPVT